MSMVFKCPACGTKFTGKFDANDKPPRCPNCNHSIPPPKTFGEKMGDLFGGSGGGRW